MRIDRRSLLAGGGAWAAAACVPIERDVPGRLAAKLRIVEAGAGGTLGAYLLDVGSGASIGHRADERFGHCSSFKASLAALVLEKVAAGDLDGGETIRWTQADIRAYAPFGEERLATGATLVELARAAQVLSDNTAANLLLARIGGPAGLTAWWRSIGDTVSRLDRPEPELNHVPPGEVMDTSTPRAMAHTVSKLVFGNVLTPANRATLRQWMTETETGADWVRASLPAGWRSGDKTGRSGGWPGMGNLAIDIGWCEPTDGGRFAFAVYYRAKKMYQSGGPPEAEATFRAVGDVLVDFAVRPAF